MIYSTFSFLADFAAACFHMACIMACVAFCNSLIEVIFSRRDQRLREAAADKDLLAAVEMLQDYAHWFSEHPPTQNMLRETAESIVTRKSFSVDAESIRHNWRVEMSHHFTKMTSPSEN